MFLVKQSLLVGQCCTLTSSHSSLWNLEIVHVFKDKDPKAFESVYVLDRKWTVTVPAYFNYS